MAKKEKKQILNIPSLGGKACLKKHGNDYYSKMATERWKKYREAKNKLAKK
jgi:hypothetical protein